MEETRLADREKLPPAHTVIRVLVADDSPFICRLLTDHLQSSADLQVIGTALNGEQTVELVKELRPDVITLDLEMPKLNGLEALERIMLEYPTPVVMISAVSHQAAAITLQALEMGAVDFVLKYTPGIDTNPEALRQEIIAKVKTASRVKVIRSLRPRSGNTSDQGQYDRLQQAPGEISIHSLATSLNLASLLPGGVVVIGASTGGPVALRELLENLPTNFNSAMIIVQHMPPAFTSVLAAQLDRRVRIKVKEAEAGKKLQPGVALVAPGGYHLLVHPDSRVELNQGPEIKGHRPSIDVTMQSVAQIYGASARGIILTGMGDDGSLGLVAIRSKGGRTFAQDTASCVVDGMPRRAIEKGVVDYVAPPAKIAQLLQTSIMPVSDRR